MTANTKKNGLNQLISIIILVILGIVAFYVADQYIGILPKGWYSNLGLGISKDKIGETVKLTMQEKFNSDPQFSKFHLTVTQVQVLSKGGSQYQGIAKVTYEGRPNDVLVEITVDGKNVLWQAPPGAFAFLL